MQRLQLPYRFFYDVSPPLIRSTGANVPEQMLFSPYACDLNNPMELERRTINLQQWVDKLESDIVRERKAKEGIQHLAQVRMLFDGTQ